jgi:hypothetical protein
VEAADPTHQRGIARISIPPREGTAKINNERDFRRSSRFAIEAALFHEQT